MATPQTYLAFLEAHARVLHRHYEITLIADFKNYPRLTGFGNVVTVHVGILGNISIFRDLIALMPLTFVLWTGKFDIIHSATPKAGLLANVAGVLAILETNLPLHDENKQT